MTSGTSGRDYVRLFAAMNEVLAALSGEGQAPEALRVSLDAAAQGMGAENALLLLVEEAEPLGLRAIHTRGALSAAQVRACEDGRSVKGVSPSVIRQAIVERRIQLVADPRLHAVASRTASLEGENYSVLCAPVVAPLAEDVLAVLYFQRNSVACAYDDGDAVWLEGYVRALGRVLALHFAKRQSERELGGVSGEGAAEGGDAELIGGSPQMRALRREIGDVYAPALGAEHPDPILILGERGTGKDLVARCLYARSARRRKPFVAVNCAEIGDELAAARFFGHRRGAFTGALNDEPGYFRAAQGGVLFLDEIADLSPRAQGCLLRVLENHVVGPVGETKEIPVEVAVVLATNRDLDEAVAGGTMRADFHDRIRSQVIRVAALRERPWDVFPLAEHFRSHHERRMKKATLGFTDEVCRALVSHRWPGNVRELARTCSLLVTHVRPGAALDGALLSHCCPEIAGAAGGGGAANGAHLPMKDALREFRRTLIRARIEQLGDVNAARESLGLPRSTFHRYARSLGIELDKPPRRGS